MKPHKCPVCEGRGKVPTGFYSGVYFGQYSTSLIPQLETCRTCGGQGIVWEGTPATPLTSTYSVPAATAAATNASNAVNGEGKRSGPDAKEISERLRKHVDGCVPTRLRDVDPVIRDMMMTQACFSFS